MNELKKEIVKIIGNFYAEHLDEIDDIYISTWQYNRTGIRVVLENDCLGSSYIFDCGDLSKLNVDIKDVVIGKLNDMLKGFKEIENE